jgi:alpha-galactosidase
MAWGAAQAATYTSTVKATTGDGIIQMSELDLTNITFYNDNGKNSVQANLTTFGADLVLKGVKYESGVGTHAPSKAVIELNGATHFYSILGVNDDADLKDNHGVVDYSVTLYKDKQATTISSGTVRRDDDNAIYVCNIDVADYDYLVLDYTNGAQTWADHCVWADARFNYSGTAPRTITENQMYASTGGNTSTDSSIVNLPTSGTNGEQIIPLSSLEITNATCGWGTIQANKSIDGNDIKLNGVTYASGVGTHSPSRIIVKLNGAVTNFHGLVGIDDEVASGVASNTSNYGTCDYAVILRAEDGTESTYQHGTLQYAADPTPAQIDVPCSGAKYLILEITNGNGGNSYDHVDWANAYLEYQEQNSTKPEIVTEDALLSTLRCATILFSQPNVRFMHKIVAADSSSKLAVKNLPAGLNWNEKRNLVEGVITQEGDYTYTVVVTDTDGIETEEPISLTVSANLQQPTPMMGWLSWNVVQGEISNTVVETVADAFITSGLYDAGYNVLAIDDLWHANARESGTNKPLEDSSKFPKGMKAAADYAHAKGLKFGIYSDGGSYTCAGKFGSYGYEAIDAQQYADWGVDMLKYDYCNAPSDLASAKERYATMGNALKATGRNIIFYMCEWGVREPWKWGTETGASCWRATYDTRDGWNGKNSGIGMVQSVAGMKDIWPYSGVNRFNDADMMCVGIHGTGKSSSDLVDGTPGMTQTEYRSQFAMWCMWSSPLMLSFDLRNTISDDDLAIMTNKELIAIDQDPMGQQAEFVHEDANGVQLYFKDLENGDVAVAAINMGSTAQNYTINFSDISALDPTTQYTARELQSQTNVGTVTGSITCALASHETKVYRLSDQAESKISNVIANAVDLKVSATSDSVNVSLNGTAGMAKRILVIDVEGHVVSSANTTAEAASLRVPAAGIYMVNVVSGAHSFTKKIKVGA